MDINNELDMAKYLDDLKYLVIYPDKSLQMYKSLRDIAKDISIDSSTISKKMKSLDECICKSKLTNYIFYIKKMSQINYKDLI